MVPIVPQVSGRVIDINVKKDQEVQLGDVLLNIDPSDYQLAVDNAETNLELAGQEIGAGTASVTTAQAKVVESQANVSHLMQSLHPLRFLRLRRLTNMEHYHQNPS